MLVSGGLASSALAIVVSRIERVSQLVVTAPSDLVEEVSASPPPALSELAVNATLPPAPAVAVTEALPPSTAAPTIAASTTVPPAKTTASTVAKATSSTAKPATTAAPAVAGASSATRRLALVKSVVSAAITPKSVIGNGHGLFFAQNMMYRHSVTVYDQAGRLVATVDDRVRLADFGFPQYTGTVTGSPVEAVSTADGRYVYVSNYQMDGPGFTNPGNDECSPGDWDPSFVYRIDTKRFVIDQVIQVGSVPKYLALTADEKRLLVTNWCSYDLSVVDVASAKEVRRVPLGPFPRGIAVAPAAGSPTWR